MKLRKFLAEWGETLVLLAFVAFFVLWAIYGPADRLSDHGWKDHLAPLD